MFEKALKESLEKIFDLPVTYSEPGESNEQERIFVEVLQARPRVKDGKETCLVEARASVYGNSEKLTYGFFMKQIDRAQASDKASFFFYDFEQNQRVFQNIVQRSFSLIYFYSGQFDPEQGSITSTDITIEVN